MRILVDMNLSPRWVEFLGASGIEASHWSDVGAINASDRVVLEWAAERHYVLLTADLGFGAILAAARRQRPSVVQIRSDTLVPEAIGAVLVAAIRQAATDLEGGALLSVEASRARLRILPLGD